LNTTIDQIVIEQFSKWDRIQNIQKNYDKLRYYLRFCTKKIIFIEQ